MTGIILHHFPTSPFAEKVRVGLGIKGLAWQSVLIPMIMPKPDLMPLTGGYRKTPVMQIGADIYCDTQLILRELERRFPEPSFYRGTDAGTANAMSFWSDRSLFATAVAVTFALRSDMLPPEFLADRAKFSGRELDKERLKAGVPLFVDQLRAQLGWYEQMLSDGRAFVMGSQPTLPDCSAYHLCWFMRENVGAAVAPLAELTKLSAWMDRVRAIGHGTRTEIGSQDALAIAKAATPICQQSQDPHDPAGRKPGDRVQVTPDDTGRDPVTGELVSATRDEIVIRRIDEQVGEIAVHFPRAGFQVLPAKS
jgi:glutathione S-transferase